MNYIIPDAIKTELAEAVAEAEANDPKRLKAELARLKALAGKAAPVIDEKALAEAEARGFERGRAAERKLWPEAVESIRQRVLGAFPAPGQEIQPPWGIIEPMPTLKPPVKAVRLKVGNGIDLAREREDTGISGPERALLSALAWWEAVGQMRPSRAMACAIAGWRVTSGHIKNVSGALKGKGLISYPSDGRLALTEAGRAIAEAPVSDGRSLSAFVRDTLTGPQAQVFDVLLRHPAGLDRPTLCAHLEWDPASGHIKNVLGSMRSMEIAEYPEAGSVRLVDWIRDAA